MEQHPQEIEEFSEWLQNRSIQNVLEVGVRRGGTIELWHRIATGIVIGIDYGGIDSLGEKETLLLSESMMDRLPRYRFVYGDSHSLLTRNMVLSELGGRQLDLLFLDGDHSYGGVKRDYEMYGYMVRRGGCIAFHDIVDTPLIRSAGHGVYRLWGELEGDKREFCIHGDWGGIGVLLC